MAIYKEDIIDVELTGGRIHRSFMSHSIGKGDEMANRFGVRIIRDGEPVDLNGSTCAGYFIRSTGDTVPITGAVTGNKAWVELPAACYAYEGQFSLAIKLTGNNVTGTMRIVDGVVMNTSTDTAVDPGGIIPSVEAMIEAINNAVESIPAEYSGFENAFTSRGLAFDLFAMYGETNDTTQNGITYSWNGQTCTVSGTATGGNSFNNFINITVPVKGTKLPVTCSVEMRGDYENVIVQLFELKNGAIVQQKNVNESGNVIFTEADADQLIARLYVSEGSTASGSISVKIYNGDSVPFGIHVFDGPQNGANIDEVGTGAFLLEDSKTYVHEPPFKPCYLLSYVMYNTGLQLAFPYTPGNPGIINPVIRSKHIEGTWTNWYTGAEFSQDISKYNESGTVNIDNVGEPGFYLLHDGYTYTNLPFSGIGFLIVYRSINARMQIAIPWTPKTINIRRNLNNGAWSSWEQPGGGNVYNVTNEYTFPEYSQAVTLNASPSITADTNDYLPPTGDTSDRTADILAMLASTGICRLGAGNYYIKNLQMPEGSTIIGSGYATKVIMSGSDSGFAIKMGSYCAVQDLQLLGAANDITIGTLEGNRHGLLWQGTYTANQTAPFKGMISNVHIGRFSGGGIRCYDTGYGTSNCLEVTNAYIWNCWAGVDIAYWSEFHKFTNVRSGQCRIGCVNNGGNNMFVNCDFSSNMEIAMLMDNSQGQSPNNTHGSCVACVFNHTASGGTANEGVGIEILNCGSGFVFEGCQIFFSRIELEDSDGIVFTGCNFGANNCDIEISGGGAVIFNGNMHQAQPTITIQDNQFVKFVNCYTRSGVEVSP